MFKSYYFATEDYQLQKPRKRLVQPLPDLSNFITNDTKLKKYANFGMEMMKWLPKFEQMYYSGKQFASQKDVDAGNSATLTHGNSAATGDHPSTDLTVTTEWMSDFNRYAVNMNDDSEMAAVFKGGDGYFTDTGYFTALKSRGTANGGKIDNLCSVRAWEDTHTNVDGFTDWRGNTWIAGQNHREGAFGPGNNGTEENWAGQSMGAGYQNLDFQVAAGEWNHIMVPKKDGVEDAKAAADVNTNLFITTSQLNIVGYTNFTQLTNWLNSTFPGMSFYDIVMDRTNGYAKLTSSKDVFKLVLAMTESRERIWKMENDVYGPVANCRNDAAMKSVVTDFVSAHNPGMNYHSLQLFGQLFQIQHSVINRMTQYWAPYQKDIDNAQNFGYNYGRLDNYRFNKFTEDLGGHGFNQWVNEYKNYTHSSSECSKESGKLYEWRNAYSSLNQDDYEAEKDEDEPNYTKINKYDKANGIIEQWFGAFLPEYGKPCVADMPGWFVNGDGNKQCLGSASGDPTTDAPGSWRYVSWLGKYVFAVNEDFKSLGYDRKFYEHSLVTSTEAGGAGTRGSIDEGSENWRKLVNEVYPSTYINPLPDGDYIHQNYAAFQFRDLNNEWVGQGTEYQNNWVVHLIGELWKNGGGAEMRKIVGTWQQRRLAAAEYRYDISKTEERRNEIADDKQAQAKQAAKIEGNRAKEKQQAAKRRHEEKAMEQAAEKHMQQRRNAISKDAQMGEQQKSQQKQKQKNKK